jgi:drug/metabolite transporter (DMT)-like permease
MAWGTFEPAVRLVYKYQPSIPPFLFSFLYYLVAASALGTMVATSNDDETGDHDDMHERSSDDSSQRAGLELGTYLFVGNALQVIGLQTVASDKAAFLLQLTTVFVPLVQCVWARNLWLVTQTTWLACVIALFGVALIGLDGAGPGNHASMDATALLQSMSQWNNFGTGDWYIMLGALFYSFHCLRLETYARTTSAVKLAAAKATTETVWSGLVICICLTAATIVASPSSNDGALHPHSNPVLDLAQTSGRNLVDYVAQATSSSMSSSSTTNQHWPQVVLATVWTGLVTVAYTIYAQSYGQAQVSATTANLIYSIQPFFTALVAFFLLGETLGAGGFVGGIFIGAAVLLVVLDENDSKVDMQ